MSASSLGSHLRLRPLHLNELPSHPALDSLLDRRGQTESTDNSTPSRPLLKDFVDQILGEAHVFMESCLPTHFTKKSTKKSPPSTDRVDLLARSFSSADLKTVDWGNSRLPRQWSGHGDATTEHWFARRSRHANRSEDGAADYSEFDRGTRKNHPQREKDYTPDVYDCPTIVDWKEELEHELSPNRSFSSEGGNYSDVEMSIHEMCHSLPTPLFNRVFPVLIVTAEGPVRQSGVVVQIPVDISNLAGAFYSNGRNLQAAESRQQRKRVVFGKYVSIETIRILPDSKVDWLMATASDAGGWLPMWLQKMFVPGQLAKDVGLFMDWVQKMRNTPEWNQSRDSVDDESRK